MGTNGVPFPLFSFLADLDGSSFSTEPSKVRIAPLKGEDGGINLGIVLLFLAELVQLTLAAWHDREAKLSA